VVVDHVEDDLDAGSMQAAMAMRISSTVLSAR